MSGVNLQWPPLRSLPGINPTQVADDNVTDRRVVDSDSGRRAAMDVSPNDSVPGAGPLDDVYSRIGIRPICRGPRKRARRHPGHREGRLRFGSSGRHCHLGNRRLLGPAYSDHRPSRVFPLFRRGAWKLQDHDRRRWIRGLDSGERGGRFGRQSTAACPPYCRWLPHPLR